MRVREYIYIYIYMCVCIHTPTHTDLPPVDYLILVLHPRTKSETGVLVPGSQNGCMHMHTYFYLHIYLSIDDARTRTDGRTASQRSCNTWRSFSEPRN